jgi:hypothetical protein
MIDEEPQPLRPDLLAREHLDVRLAIGETLFDVECERVGMHAQILVSGEKKVGCEAHLQARHPVGDANV